MTSMASLREKLHKRKLGKAHLHSPIEKEEQNDVSDHTSWLRRIENQGNRPEDWLEYTDFITKGVTFSSERIRNEYVSNTYCQATEAVLDDTAKKSSAYALLLVKFANFKSLYNEDDARSIFYKARIIAWRFAIVHIAAAQFELKLGNKDKCKKILDKARADGPKPVKLFDTAYQRFYFGYDELLTENDLEKYQNEEVRFCPPPDPQETVRKMSVTPAPDLNPQESVRKMSVTPAPDLNPQETVRRMSVTPAPDLNPQETVPRMSPPAPDLNMSIDAIDFNTSTTEYSEENGPCNGNNHPVETNSPCVDKLPGLTPHITLRNQASRKKKLLSKLHLPTREEATGMLSGSLENKSHCIAEEDEEGILGLGASTDTISFRSHKPRNVPAKENTRGDEADTLPLAFDLQQGQCNRGLRSHHSTPDCKNPGTLSMSSQKKKINFFVGQPKRILRKSLPHLSGGGYRDERSDTFNLTPLPEYHSPEPLPLSEQESHPWMKGADGDSGIQAIDQPDRTTPMDCEDSSEPAPFRMPSLRKQPKPLHVEVSNGGAHHKQPQISPPVFVPPQNVTKPHLPNPKLYPVEGQVQVTPAVSHPQEVPVPSSSIQPHNMKTPQQNGRRPGTAEFSVPAATPLQMATPQQYVPQVPYPYQHVMPAMTPVQQNYPIQYVYTPSTKQHQVLTLNGKVYSILKCIGRGGSSKVYEALDPDNSLCAIKMVNMDGADESTLCSYKNEISLLKQLQKSDRVVKLYDYKYDESGNTLYVVMERGETDLATLFRGHKKLKDITIKFYWQEMLEAVVVLHQEGIVHSDLKPANFLLVSGHLKLIDFGIANAIQQDMTSVTRDQQVGTLNFISPEAIMDAGSKVDESGRPRPRFKIGVKSDVWSLGCILYHMVYGRTPFHSISNQVLKLQAIINPNHTIDFPTLPNKHLHDVLKRCLTRVPQERPNIDELLAHAYLRDGTEATSPKPANLDQESILRLMHQMAKANVDSPRSLSAISQNVQELLAQLQRSSIGDQAMHKPGTEGPTSATHAQPKSTGTTDTKTRPHVRHVPRAPLTDLNLEIEQMPKQ